MDSLIIDTGTSSYPIFFAEGIMGSPELSDLIAPYCKGQKVVIITDEHVAPRYLTLTQDELAQQGKQVHSIVLSAGEATKSFASFQRVCEEILALQPDRRTTLIALGGGVIGDLTGFVASVVVRGIPFIQIPTTLLAQVDSSVGGKTAINCAAGKNLIGSFYQPVAVIMDVTTLDTLPRRETLAGYGEIIKYGLLGDADFYETLLRDGEQLIAGERTLQRDIIRHCCAMKAAIVGADEKEQGKRALLNLGHTFAHAIEKAAHYDGSVLHGEAVALGCLMAMSLSPAISAAEIDRLTTHYRNVGLPCRLSDLQADIVWDATTLTHYCYQDKKVNDGALTFILLNAIGDAYINHTTDPAQVENIFQEYR